MFDIEFISHGPSRRIDDPSLHFHSNILLSGPEGQFNEMPSN
jgi:hypothetical protein